MHINPQIPLAALHGRAIAGIDFLNWQPAGHGDQRGPCPVLNSLANHNIIPHNGQHLTVDLIVPALQQVFNISPDLANFLFQSGLSTAPDPSTGFFDLQDLDKHNAIEHDASLSRSDFYFSGIPGDAKFNATIFNDVLSYFEHMEYITVQAAAAARYSRVKDSRAHTPGFTYTDVQQITSYAETALYMKTMVDASGQTRVDFVKILFGTCLVAKRMQGQILI